jgi:trigger factor
MQFNLEKLDKNFVSVGVTVGTDEIEEALAGAYKRVVNKVNLPGFRKGHIPRPILE